MSIFKGCINYYQKRSFLRHRKLRSVGKSLKMTNPLTILVLLEAFHAKPQPEAGCSYQNRITGRVLYADYLPDHVLDRAGHSCMRL